MKITIYELLGLVKDGKAPKKIAYNSVILEYIVIMVEVYLSINLQLVMTF